MSASWRLNQYSRSLCREIPKSEPKRSSRYSNPGPLVRESDALPLHHCLLASDDLGLKAYAYSENADESYYTYTLTRVFTVRFGVVYIMTYHLT